MWVNRSMKRSLSIALVAASLSIGACSPIVDKRGYVPEEDQLSKVAIGQDTKDQIYSKLGSPSTTATFENNTWYYISSRTERFGFFAPRIVDRQVVAVSFDENDLVANVANYGLEDGRVVNYVDRTTPTRGKELTFLEQMFGNIGRLPGPGGGGGN